MNVPFPVANTLRSIPIPALFWVSASGHKEAGFELSLGLLVLFVASYLTNWCAHQTRAKKGKRVTWVASLLLGLLFTMLTSFFLAIAASLDGGSVSVFIALFLTYLLYFIILLFLPSIPLIYIVNRWRPERVSET
jgi:F0F1-type ATP synthase assembly protein I